MSDRNLTRIAWTLCVVTIFAIVFNVFFDLRIDDTVSNVAGSVENAVTFTVFAITGALIISRQPHNKVGWLLMVESALVFAAPVDTYFNSLNQAPEQLSLLTWIGLWISSWLWLWYIFPILFIPLFFPTGKLPSARWRWLVTLGLGLCLLFVLMVTSLTEFIAYNESWTVANPIGFLRDPSVIGTLFPFLVLTFALLCVVSLFLRYRHAKRLEREQIKWLLYAAALFFGIYTLSFLTNTVGGAINDLVVELRSLAVLLLPVSIAVAILRYRLYDIDVVIRKTLIYAVLTGLLALAYFGSVILLQNIVGRAAGEQSPLIIVVSTLLIAALFGTLRKRVQAFIDRTFYRQRYDAQQILEQFAQTTRDEVEIDVLQAELLRVVQETMQPESLVMWLASKQEDKP